MTGRKHKPGDIVSVYFDPLEKRMAEGRARIVRELDEIAPGVSQYAVVFLWDVIEENEVPRAIADASNEDWTVDEILEREG